MKVKKQRELSKRESNGHNILENGKKFQKLKHTKSIKHIFDFSMHFVCVVSLFKILNY